jgi:hypothetical protein
MSGLPDDHADAVAAIRDRLAETDIDWALTGSTSFALQGVSLEPDDIDVQTTEEGAYVFDELFADCRVEAVSLSSSETIRSHFGRFEVGGVPVEVMGALQKRGSDGAWESPTSIADHREFVPFRDGTVPVLSLSYEAQAYERLGRTERARLLRGHTATDE